MTLIDQTDRKGQRRHLKGVASKDEIRCFAKRRRLRDKRRTCLVAWSRTLLDIVSNISFRN